jgi:hypothetical protein
MQQVFDHLGCCAAGFLQVWEYSLSHTWLRSVHIPTIYMLAYRLTLASNQYFRKLTGSHKRKTSNLKEPCKSDAKCSLLSAAVVIISLASQEAFKSNMFKSCL